MSEILHNPLITAFCWTLLHSVWQGLLVAVAAGVMRMATRNAASSFRYALLSGLLLLLFLAAVPTFCYEWQVQTAAVSRASLNLDMRAVSRQAASSWHILTGSLRQWDISAWVSVHADQIVLLWLVILLFKTVKMRALRSVIQGTFKNTDPLKRQRTGKTG